AVERSLRTAYAVAVIIAVEEASFLAAVDRIVRCIEVERDPGWRPGMGVEKERDEKCLERSRIMSDAAIAVRAVRRMLETVERALARQGRTAAPPGRKPAQDGA